MTLMFCSFSEKPLILRLYGQGRAIHARDAEWSELYPLFESLPGVRQIIVLEINSVQTSCGFGVPVFELKEERDTWLEWAKNQGDEGINEYQQKHNQVSIDGLPTGILSE